MKLFTYLLAASILLGPTLWAEDFVKADRDFASIAHLLEKADQAFENRAWDEATRHYRSARRAYEEFAETFPAFAPDLVRFRIAYCRNQMTIIQQKGDEQPVSPRTSTTASSGKQHIFISPLVLEALQNGEIDVAEAAYVAMQATGDPSAELLRATIHVNEGNLHAARETLQQFLEKFPTNPAAHYNMAQLIMRDDQPDFEKARNHYRIAIDKGAPRDENLEIVIDFE